MATTVVLICAGATRSSRIGGFPATDEPLEEAGPRIGIFALDARFRSRVAISPMLAARETAHILGLEGATEPALADIDHGRWSGLSFADVHAADEEPFTRWMADPTHACPGGEAMASVVERVGAWLDTAATRGDPVCGITHATVIRAALADTLALPVPATLAIDVAPLSRAVLSYNRRWRLQSIGPAV